MELLGWVTASLFAPPGEAFFRELSAGTLEEALEELTGHPVALPQVAPSEPPSSSATRAGSPPPPTRAMPWTGSSSAPPTTGFWSSTGRGASRSRKPGATSPTTSRPWGRPSPS